MFGSKKMFEHTGCSDEPHALSPKKTTVFRNMKLHDPVHHPDRVDVAGEEAELKEEEEAKEEDNFPAEF